MLTPPNTLNLPTKDEITISELLGKITTLKAQLAAYDDERKHERLDRDEDNVALKHENEILSSIVEQLQKDKDHLAEENEVLVNKNNQLQQIAHNFQDLHVTVRKMFGEERGNYSEEGMLNEIENIFS